ncbi:hypothetical protein D3C78_1522860 [compost metagenome]
MHAHAPLPTGDHRIDHRVVAHQGADSLGLRVVEQAPVGIDHVQVGAVAMVVLADQPVEDAGLLEVDGATDVTQVAAGRIAHRMGDEHQQVTAHRHIGCADQRPTLAQRLDSTRRIQLAPDDLQGIGRGGQHPPRGIDEHHRVEAVGL